MKQMLINGCERPASDGATLAAINPYNGETLDLFPDASPEDVRDAVAAAQEGKRRMAQMPLKERTKMLMKFADLLEAHTSEIVGLMAAESGKPVMNGYYEMLDSVEMIRSYAEVGKHPAGDAFVDPSGSRFFTERAPLGVIACIAPFNYPILTLTFKVAPALMAGNAVIVKAASDTALTTLLYGKFALEAGIPGDCLQILTGSGSRLGNLLTEAEGIDAVSFTGSTQVGTHIAQACAKTLKRTLLELGGNDPLVIFADADLDRAVKQIVGPRIWNAGQTCCASKRFIVQKEIQEELAKRLVAAVGAIGKADPMDQKTVCGTLINEKAAKDVEAQLAHCVEQGAKLLCGGKRDGAFVSPAVLTDVTEDMDVARDMEIFGPVFPLIGFETEEEAVRIANATCFGLSAGVMSGDMARAMRVASQLEAGMVALNGTGNCRSTEAPFGGFKKSGLGRESIRESLLECSQNKTYAILP